LNNAREERFPLYTQRLTPIRQNGKSHVILYAVSFEATTATIFDSTEAVS